MYIYVSAFCFDGWQVFGEVFTAPLLTIDDENIRGSMETEIADKEYQLKPKKQLPKPKLLHLRLVLGAMRRPRFMLMMTFGLCQVKTKGRRATSLPRPARKTLTKMPQPQRATPCARRVSWQALGGRRWPRPQRTWPA